VSQVASLGKKPPPPYLNQWLGTVVYTYHSIKLEDGSLSHPRHKERPYVKNNQHKKGQPSKHKALGSNPSTTKEKKKTTGYANL
jgi:hypothetical protein